MGRILGKVEYGDDSKPRYFIHCDTAGSSFSPLFADARMVWSIYDSGGAGGLYKSMPRESNCVRVIRKTLAFGREFGPNADPNRDVRYGLATDDRLLTPIEQYGGARYSLFRHDGILHVAMEVDGGFSGVYDESICDDQRSPDGWAERFGFEDFYGKPLPLCRHCAVRLIGAE